jgi:hypothetical protein
MKIFGIGMPRTGTTSLNTALEILGFSSRHYADDETTVRELRNGNYELSILKEYDALTNLPACATFAQLDLAFPASKFVLTVRDLDDWLSSCESAWFNKDNAIPEPGSVRDFYRTLLYGCSRYNRDRFRWVAQSHHHLVSSYFSGEKADQLLVLDLTAGDGWEKLCRFLGVPIPDHAFPHSNRRAA